MSNSLIMRIYRRSICSLLLFSAVSVHVSMAQQAITVHNELGAVIESDTPNFNPMLSYCWISSLDMIVSLLLKMIHTPFDF